MSDSIDESLPKGRLLFLDALRGLDMIVLMGLAGSFRTLPNIFMVVSITP
jgi:hypothetical protein